MANRNLSITIPQDLTDDIALRRFLERVLEQLDTALGNRATIEVDETVKGQSAVATAREQVPTALLQRIIDLETNQSATEVDLAALEVRVTELEP